MSSASDMSSVRKKKSNQAAQHQNAGQQLHTGALREFKRS